MGFKRRPAGRPASPGKSAQAPGQIKKRKPVLVGPGPTLAPTRSKPTRY